MSGLALLITIVAGVVVTFPIWYPIIKPHLEKMEAMPLL